MQLKHEDEIEDIDIINQQLEKDEQHNQKLFHDEDDEEENNEDDEDDDSASDFMSSDGSVLSGDFTP